MQTGQIIFATHYLSETNPQESLALGFQLRLSGLFTLFNLQRNLKESWRSTTRLYQKTYTASALPSQQSGHNKTDTRQLVTIC